MKILSLFKVCLILKWGVVVGHTCENKQSLNNVSDSSPFELQRVLFLCTVVMFQCIVTLARRATVNQQSVCFSQRLIKTEPECWTSAAPGPALFHHRCRGKRSAIQCTTCVYCSCRLAYLAPHSCCVQSYVFNRVHHINSIG